MSSKKPKKVHKEKQERILTPQQEAFLSYYTNPKSDTFGDAYNSALKAKYEESYAKSITGLMPEWLYENICDTTMLKKAERNLNEFLDEEEDKKVKADITKFVAERLGKKKYSTKLEIDNPAQTEAIKSLEEIIKTMRK